jgi:hypothetical protein
MERLLISLAVVRSIQTYPNFKALLSRHHVDDLAGFRDTAYEPWCLLAERTSQRNVVAFLYC